MCSRLDRLLDRLICRALGHEPSWVLAVATASNAEPPATAVCGRCGERVEP